MLSSSALPIIRRLIGILVAETLRTRVSSAEKEKNNLMLYTSLGRFPDPFSHAINVADTVGGLNLGQSVIEFRLAGKLRRDDDVPGPVNAAPLLVRFTGTQTIPRQQLIFGGLFLGIWLACHADGSESLGKRTDRIERHFQRHLAGPIYETNLRSDLHCGESLSERLDGDVAGQFDDGFARLVEKPLFVSVPGQAKPFGKTLGREIVGFNNHFAGLVQISGLVSTAKSGNAFFEFSAPAELRGNDDLPVRSIQPHFPD